MPFISVLIYFILLLSPTAYGDVLKSYLTGQPYEEAHMNMLACFLVYHSIPTRGKIVGVGMEGNPMMMAICVA